jgi:hypothetical protein
MAAQRSGRHHDAMLRIMGTGCWLATWLAAQVDPLTEARTAVMATIEPRLAHAEAREVAWGAHIAAELRIERAESALRAALHAWRARDGEPARQVRLHLIDALHAIGAEMPAEEVEFLLDDALTRVPAFLVIARDVKGNAEALARLTMRRHGYGDLVPHAAGGLLVDANDREVRPHALPEHLLAAAACTLQIEVGDGRGDSGPWRSATGLGDAIQLYRPQRRFPPLPLHELGRFDACAAPGATTIRRSTVEDARIWRKMEPKGWQEIPLPPGGRAADSGVQHVRTVVEHVERRSTELAEGVPLDARTMVVWLERMARMPIPSRVKLVVPWTDNDALRTATVARIAELKGPVTPLIERLIAEGWLPTGARREYSLPVQVELFDKRQDRSVALPDATSLRR